MPLQQTNIKEEYEERADIADDEAARKTQEKREQKSENENEYVEDKIREVKGILSYYSDYGEVVWFQNYKNLRYFVTFVKSLHTVITHKVKAKFKDVKHNKDMQDLLKRGCLSYKVFSEAFKKQEQDFSAHEAWRLLKELGLAFPFEKEDSEDDETVMIPCLIKDDMEEKMKRREDEMEKSNKAVCFMYEFNRNTSTIWLYYKLL